MNLLEGERFATFLFGSRIRLLQTCVAKLMAPPRHPGCQMPGTNTQPQCKLAGKIGPCRLRVTHYDWNEHAKAR